MNDTLPQQDYSTTLSSDDIITISNIASPSQWDLSTMASVTLPASYIGADTISLSNIDLTNISWTLETKEFVDSFPNWSKVAEMREEYPALDIAMKKFEEVYKMVEDDWEAQKGNKYGTNRS